MCTLGRPLLAVSLGLTAGLALVPRQAAAQEKNGVAIQASKDHLDFTVRGELATRYHVGGQYAKPIFWPVRSPNGAALTRSWPLEDGIAGESKDHVHQKSAWFCHGDVIPEGIELKQKIKGVEGVDFWSEAKGHGNIVCTRVEGAKNQKDGAHVTTYNEWRTADGIKIMDEKRVIHFHDFGKARLLVLAIDLEASVCPITFGDTKEGSMGIRINDQIRTDKGSSYKDAQGRMVKVLGQGTLRNADGKVGEKECWGHRSAWTDYSGPIDGKLAGLAILDDPKNAYPAYWHIRGYGLNAANPFGRAKSGFPEVAGKKDLVRLAKGEHLRLRYGLVLHDGDAVSGGVADAYRRFVDLRGKE
jgi:hypothetical protein